MTILKHDDYQGEVTYEDGVLLIRLLHIDDLITAECENSSDVQAVFENLVEDYVETCKAIGKEPCKPFRGTFNVRIDPVIHRQIVNLAAEEGVSLNTWVARAIEERASQLSTRREVLSPQYIQRVIRGHEISRRSATNISRWKIGQHHSSDDVTRWLAQQFPMVVGHG